MPRADPPALDPAAIQLGELEDGSLFYLVPGAPAGLPPVQSRDLVAAWDAARQSAAHGAWGVGRCFRFVHEGGGHDIALTDPDARSWAAASDGRAAMHTRYGLSLGLRLLALVELLTRSSAAQRLVHVEAGQAELHPSLIRAAATASLNVQARFDDRTLLAALGGPCEALPPITGSKP